MQFLHFSISQVSAETLVRRGGITYHHFNGILCQQYLCQKLPKSVEFDVHWSYNVQHQCRFWDTVYSAKIKWIKGTL